MTEIKVRDASLGDKGPIVRLIGELAAEAGDRSAVGEEYVATYLSFPGNRALVAEVQGVVVGVLSYNIRPGLYHAGECCLIDEFVVTQGARGQGAGGALMEGLLDRLRAAGCVEVGVGCLPDNERAIAFYRKHGFVDEALYLERHFTR